MPVATPVSASSLHVEIGRILGEPRHVLRAAQLPDQPRRVPGRAGGQLLALQQHDVGPAELGEVIGDRTAGDAAADDDGPRPGGNGGAHASSPEGSCPLATSASRSAAMWSGPTSQQPPMIRAPSRTQPSANRAYCVGAQIVARFERFHRAAGLEAVDCGEAVGIGAERQPCALLNALHDAEIASGVEQLSSRASDADFVQHRMRLGKAFPATQQPGTIVAHRHADPDRLAAFLGRCRGAREFPSPRRESRTGRDRSALPVARTTCRYSARQSS